MSFLDSQDAHLFISKDLVYALPFSPSVGGATPTDVERADF